MSELTDESGELAEVVARLREERDAAVAERDVLRRQVVDFHREKCVSQLAQKVGFKEPADAWLYLKGAGLSDDDWDSQPAVVRALEETLRHKPYLARSGTSNPRASSLTFDDVRRMSSEEINRQWDEVQKVLAAKA